MSSLSAYLASTTRNSTYINAAILSANFIKITNNNSRDVVLDTINAQDCTRSSFSWLFTYNTGKYIKACWTSLSHRQNHLHGKAVNVSLPMAPTYRQRGRWIRGRVSLPHHSIAIDTWAVLSAVLICGLEAWSRNPDNTALRAFIRSYTDAQYNPLLDLASGSGSSSTWYSPAS
ncbi:hypothetical protein EV702DRAFT_1046277 [Suillus placidus]|uniref:Uncharacterized protein n=1 Tax=Suillus placidus TaxID=48579 RepID=A0A9P7D174_9AGAM|nr:hypothetical protein EV702DRAFT_1046277 [Suillus placidus]